MKRVLAVANQKGGVGKTTTAVNLAACFSAMRRRVLLIDLDPQGNATTGCGVDKAAIGRGTCEVLLGECAAAEAVLPLGAAAAAPAAAAVPAAPAASESGAVPATRTAAAAGGVLCLMPANQDLTSAEVRLLATGAGRERRLRQALAPIRDAYDLILIDCPPALNMLTVNALVAADGVLIPMQCEYYALEGLTSLVATIEQIRASANPALQIEGILRTMFDPRNNLGNEVSAQLMMHFGERVFRTMVPRNIRLAEAPSFGRSVLEHDPNSRGALAYLALAGEMLRRDEELAGAVPADAEPPADSSAELIRTST